MVNSKINPIVLFLTIFITLTIIIITLSTPQYFKYQYFIMTEQKIINTNNDPTTTSSGNSNVSIKVIIPTDPASNMSVTKLSSEFHVEWEVHGMTGDPEFLIQAYSMLQTLPYPLPLPIWEKPPTVKSSEGSYKFTIDPTKFQVDTWYTIRISDVNNEDINETSDPFLVTK